MLFILLPPPILLLLNAAHNNNNVNAAYDAATAATALVYDAADTAYANYWLKSYFK